MANFMSKTLNNLIDKAYKSQEKEIKEKCAFSNEDLTIHSMAVKESLEKLVYKEIKQELYDEVTIAATKQLEKEALNKKVKELEKIIYTGLILAIFVGMLVNQLTDIITYLKNGTNFNLLSNTIILVLIFAGLCILITVVIFVKDALNMIKDERS